MKKTLIAILILSLLCAGLMFVPASATEEKDPYLMDWDTVDWETFKWSDYFDNTDYDFFYLLDHWTDWMINEASVEQLVAVAKAHPDAAYSESYHYALRLRFLDEPEKMIQVQASSSRSVQTGTVEGIVSGREDQDPAALIALLSSFALPADATTAEHDILEEIVSLTEQRFDVVIPRNEAPEIIDWNTVDWENINFDHLNGDLLYSLQEWLKNEASAEELIEAAKAKWDGAFSTMYENALGSQFIEEPIAMLVAMQHDVRNKDKVVRHLARSEAYGENNVDIVEFLTKLQLSSIDAKEWAVLYEIILSVEDYLGVDIQHPEFSKIVDWNTVDWGTFNLSTYCDVQDIGWIRFENWCAWLENEATLEQLIGVVKAGMDGYLSTGYEGALEYRFVQDPLGMLTAMSQADEAYHDKLAKMIAREPESNWDVVKFLTELKIPADAKAERAMLNKIIDYAEQYHGVEIPRTGDPIALALAALLLSGMGLAVTIHRKKTIVCSPGRHPIGAAQIFLRFFLHFVKTHAMM